MFSREKEFYFFEDIIVPQGNICSKFFSNRNHFIVDFI
jgi:hypothetical protein